MKLGASGAKQRELCNEMKTVRWHTSRHIKRIRERVEEKRKLCIEVKTVREITSSRISQVDDVRLLRLPITRCGWTKLRACGKQLYAKRVLLKLKGAAYKSCQVRTSM